MTYDEAKAKIPVHAIFRHFKGNMYEVLTIAKDAETEEPVVIYQDIKKRGIIWARLASMWFDEVSEGVKRFERYQGQRAERVSQNGSRCTQRIYPELKEVMHNE